MSGLKQDLNINSVTNETPHRLLTRIRKFKPEVENKQTEPIIIASQGPPSSRVQTATEKIQALTNEVEKLRDEKEKIIQEKSQWMLKLQEDNQKLTDLLKTVHLAKDRIIRRLEEFDLDEALIVETTRDSQIDEETKISSQDKNKQFINNDFNESKLKIPLQKPTNLVSHTTVNDTWEAEFNSLDSNVRDYLWEKVLLNISDLVDRNPLVKLIPSVVVKEGINEIATELRGLIGKSFSSLLKTSTISIPTGELKSSTKEDLDLYLSKLLMSTSVRHDLIGQVTMIFTFLFIKYGIKPNPNPEEYGNNYFKNDNRVDASQSFTLYESPSSPTNNNLPRYMLPKTFSSRNISPEKDRSSSLKSSNVMKSMTVPSPTNNPRIFSSSFNNNPTNEPYMIDDEVKTLRGNQVLSQSQNVPRYMGAKSKSMRSPNLSSSMK